jgi:hypothetical protein
LANISFPTENGAYTDANWGPQDANHPLGNKIVTLTKVQSLLGHVVFRMGGPVCWGCTRERTTVSRSSCESEISATDEGTKSVLTVRHLLQDFSFPNGTAPTPVWNDNRGCVDWTKGVTVSKKLRHINMRELGVRQSQQQGAVDVRHIDGKRNIANLFTKEIKDAPHFQKMTFTITTPRRIADMSPMVPCPLDAIEGGVQTGESWSKLTLSSWIPPILSQAIKRVTSLPTAFLGTRAI